MQGSIARRDTVVRAPVRFPTATGLPLRQGVRPVSAITIPTLQAVPAVSRAPYAQTAVVTPGHNAWLRDLATHWVRWHLILCVALVVAATTIITATPLAVAGVVLLAVTLGALAVGAIAVRCLDFALAGTAVTLMLVSDLLLTAAGVAIVGPRASLLFFLAGSLLITALFADRLVVIAGGAVTFVGFVATLAAAALGRFAPVLPLDETTLRWVDGAAVFIGLTLLLVAIALVSGQLRRALASEAAVTHRLYAHDRRLLTKQIAIDADAIALQAELANALRGGAPRAVTTCEDLAPLANMINATTARLPGLLRDREERLHIERALRDLVTSLETAWAGFEWTWPAPSGTTVDRLVAILRPSSSHRAPGA